MVLSSFRDLLIILLSGFNFLPKGEYPICLFKSLGSANHFLEIYSAYVAGRLATLAVILFYATSLLNRSPLDYQGWDQKHWGLGLLVGDLKLWELGLLILAFLLVIKGLWQLYSSNKKRIAKRLAKYNEKLIDEHLAKYVYGLRATLIGVLVAACLLLCWGFPPSSEQMSIKDAIGYLTGLIVSILVWRLHSMIHRGIVQMWHYTRGEETAPPPRSKLSGKQTSELSDQSATRNLKESQA